jgi:hypothetical protein
MLSLSPRENFGCAAKARYFVLVAGTRPNDRAPQLTNSRSYQLIYRSITKDKLRIGDEHSDSEQDEQDKTNKHGADKRIDKLAVAQDREQDQNQQDDDQPHGSRHPGVLGCNVKMSEIDPIGRSLVSYSKVAAALVPPKFLLEVEVAFCGLRCENIFPI